MSNLLDICHAIYSESIYAKIVFSQRMSLEIEDFVQKVLVPLNSIQNATPPATKLGASKEAPPRVVCRRELFAIPVMRGPNTAT